MVSLETWILLVDVQFKVIGEIFPGPQFTTGSRPPIDAVTIYITFSGTLLHLLHLLLQSCLLYKAAI